ncbi:MAG: OsmC family protein [Candidatus Nanohaloarchaea archaeon]
MVEYPVIFETSSEVESGEEEWDSSLGAVSKPEEFGGTDAPSPERLFAASLENCVLATFATIAGRKGLEFDSADSESRTVLDRRDDGRPAITEASIDVTVRGVGDESAAREIARQSEKNCFIHRSVKTDVDVSFKFS